MSKHELKVISTRMVDDEVERKGVIESFLSIYNLESRRYEILEKNYGQNVFKYSVEVKKIGSLSFLTNKEYEESKSKANRKEQDEQITA